ncbi:MAG TPA: MBL fold metallo-hydrolase [Thermoanaerobaculia bacterium]|nr:MBL fold metallo-hydrolase [Thermoanaerobaculia bacterium]
MSGKASPSGETGLYEQMMAAIGGAAHLPAAKQPRPSAAVVLWRQSGGGLEVFWIRRADTLAFMAGWHAFPGGGLARTDAECPLLGLPIGAEGFPGPAAMPETLTEGIEPPPHLIPGLAACALRELLEETGILPVPELFAGSPSPDLAQRLARARRALNEGKLSLAETLTAVGLEADASRLTFAGRWLTPPLGPLRFDNRFFLLEWPADLPVQPTIEPGEAVEGEWIDPSLAFERWRRGEVITAPPILHLLRVLAEDGVAAGRPRLLEPAEANLGPFRRIEFRPWVVMLPLKAGTLLPATHTNAYLLGREELVLVDPGSAAPGEIDRLEAAVQATAERGQRVAAIWLTHHHPDHVGGVLALVERLGLPVAAHAETASRVAARGIRVDRLLEDEERILLAGSPPFPVRVLHTPGHARGHLCFLDEEGRSLLAGDLLSTVSTIVIDPPEGNMDDYLASLERIRALGPLTLFPAHGPPAKDGAATLAELIRHRLWREERILEAWREGMREVEALVERVYEDAPPPARPLAARQVTAHLERLRRAGFRTRSGSG